MVFKQARRASPGAEILIWIAGYDDDPRELWDFPEVRRYVRWWSRAAGLGSWQAAIEIPWADFDACMGVLIACNVFGDEHPFDLRKPDTPPANSKIILSDYCRLPRRRLWHAAGLVAAAAAAKYEFRLHGVRALP